MATPDQVGTVYDIVIEGYGFILEENSYRLTPAPQMAPQITQGPQNLQDLVGEQRITFWDDWRGGMDDRYPSAKNRYYRGENLWGVKKGELTLAPLLQSVYVNSSANTHKPIRNTMMKYGSALWSAFLYQPGVDSFGTGLAYYDANAPYSWVGLANQPNKFIHDVATFDGNFYAFHNSGYYKATNIWNLLALNWTEFSENFRVPIIYDDRLYVGGDTPTTTHQLFAMVPGTTSFAQVASLGAAEHEIRSMATLAGTLYVGKDDGLWAFRQNRAWKVVDVMPTTVSRNPSTVWAANFEGMTEHQGWLYYHIYDQPFRYNGSTIEALYSEFVTQITGFKSSGQLLYMLGMDNSAGGVWVMRDQGFHNLAYGVGLPYAVGEVGTETLHETHFMFFDTTQGLLAAKKIVWQNVKNLVPTKYASIGRLHLPWADDNKPTWLKAYKDIMVHASFDTSAEWTASPGYDPGPLGGYLKAFYTPTGHSYYPLDTSICQQVQGTLEETRAAAIADYRTARRASGLVELHSSTNRDMTPHLHFVGITHVTKEPEAMQHFLRVVCENQLELRDGSQETWDAIQLESIIGALSRYDRVKFFGPAGVAAGVVQQGVPGTDYSAALRIAGDGQTATLSGGQNLCIGAMEPFDLIHVKFATLPTNTTFMQLGLLLPLASWSWATSVHEGQWQWTSLLNDGTAVGGNVFRQSGTIAFVTLPNWGPTILAPASSGIATAPLYWARLNVSPTLGDTCVIDSIRLGRWVHLKFTGMTSQDIVEEIRPVINLTAVEV